jgi:hypothetical protein
MYHVNLLPWCPVGWRRGRRDREGDSLADDAARAITNHRWPRAEHSGPPAPWQRPEEDRSISGSRSAWRTAPLPDQTESALDQQKTNCFGVRGANVIGSGCPCSSPFQNQRPA